MTLEITVSNRQRRHTLLLSEVENMAETISSAVCRNLEESPCRWLSLANVREIEERGIISVVLVSDERIRKLNKEWRGKDKATDVLSFPLDEEAPPADMPFEIGEVIISIDRAKAQAEDLGHSFERELAFLTAHGMLHLLGFDHETPEEEADMFGRQRIILEKSGFPRL